MDVVLQYQTHLECAHFAVTGLGKQKVILGLSWLHEHNPEVDWKTGKVKMSRCPSRCQTCFLEEHQDQRKVRAVEEKVAACRVGPMPEMHICVVMMEEVPDEDVEVDDLPALQADSDEDDEDEFEDGDRKSVV